MKSDLKPEAIKLRNKGYSLNEIKEVLPVSKSTLSLWLKDIVLSDKARARIESKMTKGQIVGRLIKLEQTKIKEKFADDSAKAILSNVNLSPSYEKLLCAMIYYCEGRKDVRSGINFVNSDPGMIRAFLGLLRKSYKLDEKRLRGCVHVHSYHDIDEQLKFWSETCKIPVQQFIKSFQKPHSGLRKKEGYQGCVSVRYCDVKIAREMKALALEFMQRGL